MVWPSLDIQISFWKGLSSATCIVVFMTASICTPKGIWKKASRKNHRKQSMK